MHMDVKNKRAKLAENCRKVENHLQAKRQQSVRMFSKRLGRSEDEMQRAGTVKQVCGRRIRCLNTVLVYLNFY